MFPVHFKGSLTPKKVVLIHLFSWLLLGYFTLLSFDRSNPYYFSVEVPDVFDIIWGLVFIGTFYFNYLVIMPRVFKDFNWQRAFLGLIAAYAFFIVLRFLLEEVIMSWLTGEGNYVEGTHPLYYLYDNLYYSTFPLIPSVLLWLLVLLIRLLEYSTFIAQEKREIEVKFLKAQLNPHFMFNTLNNIYSLVHLKSEQALPAIEKLSTMMRFTTYETQKETIRLEDELTYIKSFLKLEQLRHVGSYQLNVNADSSALEIKIPPLILSPLVENAVKHGDHSKEVSIEIALEVSDNKLLFRVNNPIGKQKKDKTPGIGLENLKKRLQAYYPGKHELLLQEEDQFFTAQLELRL